MCDTVQSDTDCWSFWKLIFPQFSTITPVSDFTTICSCEIFVDRVPNDDDNNDTWFIIVNKVLPFSVSVCKSANESVQ